MKKSIVFLSVFFSLMIMACSSGNIQQSFQPAGFDVLKQQYTQGIGLELSAVGNEYPSGQINVAMESAKKGIMVNAASYLSTRVISRIKEDNMNIPLTESESQSITTGIIHGVEITKTFIENRPGDKSRIWAKGLWSEASMKRALKALQDVKISQMPLKDQAVNKLMISEMEQILGGE